MAFWLFKTEPNEYSYQDLVAEPNGYARWDGIRNYQARNFMRDQIAVGDEVFIYHSRCKALGIVGTAKVVREAYADPAQFDEASQYFDPKASKESPRWYCVDIAATTAFHEVVAMATLKQQIGLDEMLLLKQGRLSIQPVTEQQWHIINSLAVSSI